MKVTLIADKLSRKEAIKIGIKTLNSEVQQFKTGWGVVVVEKK